jgi:hypothetical protein
MARSLAFGSYTFPAGFWLAEDPSARLLPASKLPRADGARTQTAYMDARRFVVRGGFRQGVIGGSDIATSLDSLRAGLAVVNAAFYPARDDRYYRNCQCESISTSRRCTTEQTALDVETVIVSGDPFQYGATETNDAWAVTGSNQTKVIAAAGNAYEWPKLEVTIGGAGAITLACVISSDTTGESFTLAGAVNGGDVIVVDCLAQTVVIGSTDKLALFDGQWLRLSVGNSTLREVYTSGTISSIAVKHRSRWW